MAKVRKRERERETGRDACAYLSLRTVARGTTIFCLTRSAVRAQAYRSAMNLPRPLWLCVSVSFVAAGCTHDVAATRAPLIDDAGSSISEDRSVIAPTVSSIDTEVDRASADQERGYTTWLASLPEAERLAEARFERDDVGGPAGSQLMVEWSGRHTATSLWSRRLRLPAPDATDATGRAIAFLVDRRALFGTVTGETLVPRGADHLGTDTVVRFTQAAAGLPVFGAGANIHVSDDGAVTWVAVHLVPEGLLPRVPPRSARGAPEAASLVGADPAGAVLGWFDPEIAAPDVGGDVRLAWLVHRRSAADSFAVYVDDATGEELASHSDALAATHRETFWDNGTWASGPGALQRDDVCHTSGVATCPAGWCTGACQTPSWPGHSLSVNNLLAATESYISGRLGRDGWDDGLCGTAGHPCTDADLHRMRITADVGGAGTRITQWRNFDDPIHPAQVQLAGCDYLATDAVGHEFTHALASATVPSPFGDTLQGGTVAEGLPDAVGQFVEQYSAGSTDWVVRGLNVCGDAGPDLRNPSSKIGYCSPSTSAPYPDHLSNFRDDCVGGVDVHFNSSIVAKIAFLMGREPSEGSVTHWGVPVTGIGESAASRAWYYALTRYLAGATTHTDFAVALDSACLDVYYETFDFNHYAQCHYALLAAGIWSRNGIAGWNIDNAPVGLASFTVGGQARKWAFYRPLGVAAVRYRYRTCPTFGGCSWSAETNLDSTTTGPSVATFGGNMWACFGSGAGTLIWCDRIDSTGTRHFGPDPAGYAAAVVGPPSLVPYSSKLFLAYRNSLGRSVWRRYDPVAGVWGAEVDQGILASAEPVLASGDDDPWRSGASTLWMVYRRTSDGRLAYRKYNDATNLFGLEVVAGPADVTATILDRPAAVLYRDRLHVVGRNYDFVPILGYGYHLRYMSCALPCTSASQWSRWSAQDGSASQYPSLDAIGASDGALYLWRRDGSDALQWRYKMSQ